MKLSKTAISAIAAAMLFLLRNPSKFSWGDPDKCLMGWAVKLKTGKTITELWRDGGSKESYNHLILARALEIPEDDAYTLLLKTDHGKYNLRQSRSQVKATIFKAVALIVGDSPKTYETALLSVIADFLVNPSSYDQYDPQNCIIARASRKLGARYRHVRETLIGVSVEEQDKIFFTDNWPNEFKTRYDSLTENGRIRDYKRNVALVGIQRTLHYLATGK
jgi:hypothetical protein